MCTMNTFNNLGVTPFYNGVGLSVISFNLSDLVVNYSIFRAN